MSDNNDNLRSDLPSNAFFFMHVSKTAGSYVNETLRTALGNRFLDHCEEPGRLATTAPVSLRSGHIILSRWLEVEQQRGWSPRRFTLIRDPIKQLASHILWLDHYNLPQFFEERDMFKEPTQHVIKTIGSTNLSDPEELDRFLTDLDAIGLRYFDNNQARYFVDGFEGIGSDRPLHLGMRDQALQAVEYFAAIGINDDLPGFINMLSRELGIPLLTPDQLINKAAAVRTIDIKDPLVKRALKRRLSLDLWLYDTVYEKWEKSIYSLNKDN
ncbi:hypothetical protein E2F50_01050 [Rhizobium deserti]|uniref:Sulfotransferase family protein n=1 Tax=Rhizobium deserti TaxID=2547961 RepID=A0A4R5ULS5_9HYPH|nr:hypothetical protein [Rhizobium deserti]TDK38771.1 hypothetical protein E2F50_01050 [Rhizobium deserti]